MCSENVLFSLQCVEQENGNVDMSVKAAVDKTLDISGQTEMDNHCMKMGKTIFRQWMSGRGQQSVCRKVMLASYAYWNATDH